MEDQRIIEILLRMEENQKMFFSEVLSMVQGKKLDSKLWGDIVDVQNFFNCSRSTAFRISKDNFARKKKIRGKVWYYMPDFLPLRNHYLK